MDKSIIKNKCLKCKKYLTSLCDFKPIVIKHGDVFKHTLLVLQNAPKTIEGQLAALLHDVGKPSTQKIFEDKIQFKDHAEIGSDIARAILYRLKFDKSTIDKVTNLVKNHMRVHDLENASEKALRKFIRDIGDEMVDSILDLAEADSLGSYPVENVIPQLRERIQNIRNSPIKLIKKPVLNGDEIMNILSVKPGPLIKTVNEYLLNIEDEYAVHGKNLSKEEAKKLIIKEFGK